MPMKKKSKPLTAKERQAFVEELLVTTVALRLAQAMGRSAVTPRHLARRLHVRTATVQRWLRGEGNLTLKTIARLFDALDCELHILLGPPVRAVLQQDTARRFRDVRAALSRSEYAVEQIPRNATQRFREGVTNVGQWIDEVKQEAAVARAFRSLRSDRSTTKTAAY